MYRKHTNFPHWTMFPHSPNIAKLIQRVHVPLHLAWPSALSPYWSTLLMHGPESPSQHRSLIQRATTSPPTIFPIFSHLIPPFPPYLPSPSISPSLTLFHYRDSTQSSAGSPLPTPCFGSFASHSNMFQPQIYEFKWTFNFSADKHLKDSKIIYRKFETQCFKFIQNIQVNFQQPF
jgi:hypothetical protein